MALGPGDILAKAADNLVNNEDIAARMQNGFQTAALNGGLETGATAALQAALPTPEANPVELQLSNPSEPLPEPGAMA